MDYNKNDDMIKHLQTYLYKNYPFVIIGYLTVYFFGKYTEKIPLMTLMTLFFMMGWSYYSHMLFHQINSLHNYHHGPFCDTLKFRVLEFFIDFAIFGGIILIPIGKCFEYFCSRMFNYYGIFFWALLYSTYHINWHFTTSLNPHQHHHKYLDCNYGPDIIDILFGTKMEIDVIENMNSAIINIVCIYNNLFNFSI
jgi:hypothetical protein